MHVQDQVQNKLIILKFKQINFVFVICGTCSKINIDKTRTRHTHTHIYIYCC